MTAQKKPNVIFFFTDQQRWDTSGLFGNTMDLTPNFDRMAMEGTHCYNAYTCQPVCLPARSCLQTGLYASQMEIYDNSGELPEGSQTLGHYFRDAGYRTGYIGKWHMCHDHIVPRHRRDGYDDWLGANTLESVSDAYHTIMYDDDGQEVFLPGYRVDAETDIAIRYIHDHRDHPFFLMVSYLEPHFQNTRDDYPAPDGYEQRYLNPWTPPDLQALNGTSARHLPGYYGMVKRLDEALGRIRDALKSMGMDDNTIILYTADHGCHFKTRNSEYKRSCHDGSIRVPMALTGPGFDGGGRLQNMISLIDVPPTLLDACGIDVPDHMQGHSILPLIRRQADDWPGEVFVEITDTGWMRRCVRTNRWKYSVKALTPKQENHGHADAYEEEELYDMMADPWELNNVMGFESHAKVTDIMRQRLLRHMEALGQSITIRPAPEVASGQKVVNDDEVNL